VSQLTDFFQQNASNWQQLFAMLEAGIGTPNDRFPQDAVLRFATYEF